MLKHKPALRNIELRIAYVGTPFFGWQIQPDVPTVQGLLHKALERTLDGEVVRSIGSSRTDTGVHAHNNHVTFRTSHPIPPEGLKRKLNHLLPGTIRVLDVFDREPEFSARYHARAKHYTYFIQSGDDVSPFSSDMVWPWRPKLDHEAMAACAAYLIGTRCFKALQASADPREDTETTIFKADVREHGSVVAIDILGRHFLYHMVRNIAGSLMLVGRGDWTVEEFKQRLDGGDRSMMGRTAPAQGLHLFKVYFGEGPYHYSQERDCFLPRLI